MRGCLMLCNLCEANLNDIVSDYSITDPATLADIVLNVVEDMIDDAIEALPSIPEYWIDDCRMSVLAELTDFILKYGEQTSDSKMGSSSNSSLQPEHVFSSYK